MELLKEIVIDFCLFSLIEGYIFCLFFEKIGGCRKFKWYEILILSIINCIISKILPPVIYQIIGILYMGIWLNKRDNINNGFNLILLFTCILIIIEMLFSFIYEYVFYIKSYEEHGFKLFLLFLPTKIIEIYFINKWGDKMKWFIGEVRK